MSYRPFALYCRATVDYSGRASSTLTIGNYLILYKPDGSLAIHDSHSIKPINYQTNGTELTFVENPNTHKRCILQIVAKNKKETLVISVYVIHHDLALDDWSKGEIEISRTEHQLRDYIAANTHKWFKFKPQLVETEYPTPYGNVDVYIKEQSRIIHLVEVKRHKINMAACGQLARYANYFKKSNKVIQYLAAPTISKNAQAYADKHKQIWLQVDFC